MTLFFAYCSNTHLKKSSSNFTKISSFFSELPPKHTVLSLSWRRSLIQNPVHWFSLQSVDWFLFDRDLRHERVKDLKNYKKWPLGGLPRLLVYTFRHIVNSNSNMMQRLWKVTQNALAELFLSCFRSFYLKSCTFFSRVVGSKCFKIHRTCKKIAEKRF